MKRSAVPAVLLYLISSAIQYHLYCIKKVLYRYNTKLSGQDGYVDSNFQEKTFSLTKKMGGGEVTLLTCKPSLHKSKSFENIQPRKIRKRSEGSEVKEASEFGCGCAFSASRSALSSVATGS